MPELYLLYFDSEGGFGLEDGAEYICLSEEEARAKAYRAIIEF